MLYRGNDLPSDLGSLANFLVRATSFSLAHHPHHTFLVFYGAAGSKWQDIGGIKGNRPVISAFKKKAKEFWYDKSFHTRVKFLDSTFQLIVVVHMTWVDALNRVKSSILTSQYTSRTQ